METDHAAPVAETDQTLQFEKFVCQYLLIGTHAAKLCEVKWSQTGFDFRFPTIQDPTITPSIHLAPDSIAKIIYCYDVTLPVLFILVMPSVARNIRATIGMPEKKQENAPYFDITTSNSLLKRIVLLADDDGRLQPLKLEKMFGGASKMDSIDTVTAKRMLQEYEAFGLLKVPTTTDEIRLEAPRNSPVTDVNLLTYPAGERGAITINTSDYRDLERDSYLNDALIDFYIKFLHKEVFSAETRRLTHVSDSFFYTRLLTPLEGTEQMLKDPSLSRLQKATLRSEMQFDRVKKWDRNVNLFEKDFIVVPINQDAHWYLAIVCFIRLDGPVAFDNEQPVDPKTYKAAIKQPCILIFDSVGQQRNEAISNLRMFLTERYRDTKRADQSERIFTRDNLIGHNVKVPTQRNNTDCGLFLLQYVESFFVTEPFRDFRIPMKGHERWFDKSVVLRKREDLSILITNLVAPERLPLPAIQFSTKDGVPLQTTTVRKRKKVSNVEAIGEMSVERVDGDCIVDQNNSGGSVDVYSVSGRLKRKCRRK